jgi:hypothetical protein
LRQALVQTLLKLDVHKEPQPAAAGELAQKFLAAVEHRDRLVRPALEGVAADDRAVGAALAERAPR